MIRVPFNDFKEQYESIRCEIDAAVQRVLSSGWYILGPELEAFEQEFARYIGTPYCVGCNSGTDALYLALKALEIGDGDEVITTSVTAFPTITAIQMAGAIPVVIDISPENGLIATDQLQMALTTRTSALIPVHLYGQCCSMDSIISFASDNGIPVIEDCAQSAGATWNSKKAGSMGRLGCFSFYPTKNLGAFGDGGAICTSDPILVGKIKKLRNYGQSDRYHHDSFGVNTRLDELQAAILRAKLPYLDSWNLKRNRIAERYQKHLPEHCLLGTRNECDHIHHLFPMLPKQRTSFMNHLERQGITTLIHYPVPVHRQGAFEGRHLACPAAEDFCSRVVSLPLYPSLTDGQIQRVINAVNSIKEIL